MYLDIHTGRGGGGGGWELEPGICDIKDYREDMSINDCSTYV